MMVVGYFRDFLYDLTKGRNMVVESVVGEYCSKKMLVYRMRGKVYYVNRIWMKNTEVAWTTKGSCNNYGNTGPVN